MVAHSNPQRQRMTEAEYLSYDAESDIRHEYVNGEVIAMSGASVNHSTICMNIGASLHAQLRQKPCLVMQTEQRVHIASKHSYRYPDVVVVCGERQLTDQNPPSLLNPLIIVEVLSPSTGWIDQSQKLDEYRQIVSLQEYLIVAQTSSRIEHYVRHSDTGWLSTVYINLNDTISLDGLECSLQLSDVYEKVDFDEA